ncbi:MAG: hypothetical protein KA369_01490 [Spirochaetes bacterium]|nr:hypothetical protein [Spirochaetota bacterium]
MASEKPYTLYKFIGVKPFKKLLEEAGVTHLIFDDEAVPRLFKERADYFNEAEDSIAVGKCLQDGVDVYFAEFGIKITKSFLSYIVFIFDHHPTVEEMLATADDLEQLIQQHLEGVNLDDFKNQMQ